MVTRVVEEIVRASQTSMMKEMASLFAETQQGRWRLVYIGRNRARMCIAQNKYCNVELFLSDKGSAMLTQWWDGSSSITADTTGIICKLEYNHHDGETVDEAAR